MQVQGDDTSDGFSDTHLSSPGRPEVSLTRWAPLGGPTVTCPEVVLLLDLPWGKKRARSVEALMLPDQRALAEMLFYIDIEVRGTEGGDTNASSKSLQVGMEPSQSPSRTQGATRDIAPSLPLN